MKKSPSLLILFFFIHTCFQEQELTFWSENIVFHYIETDWYVVGLTGKTFSRSTEKQLLSFSLTVIYKYVYIVLLYTDWVDLNVFHSTLTSDFIYLPCFSKTKKKQTEILCYIICTLSSISLLQKTQVSVFHYSACIHAFWSSGISNFLDRFVKSTFNSILQFIIHLIHKSYPPSFHQTLKGKLSDIPSISYCLL